jgi:hypothetical protein
MALHGADALVVNISQTPGVVILEYEVQGNAVGSGKLYENRLSLPCNSRLRPRPPQGNIELMGQKQVLGLKPTPRLEQVEETNIPSECRIASIGLDDAMILRDE